MGWTTLTPIIALIISFIALGVTLRKEFWVVPNVDYDLTELTEYPRSDLGLSLSVKRAGTADYVLLKHGLLIHLRSNGKEPASNVQARIRASQGALIVATNVDDALLVERLPDLGQDGKEEIMLSIPLMVPGEEVRVTVWYGVPGNPDKTPVVPSVKVRHTKGLGRLVTSM
jgi:hypothetical protein